MGDMIIQKLALRQQQSSGTTGSMERALILIYSIWLVSTLACLMALLRLPLVFRPTPKSSTGSLNLSWLLPQLATTTSLVIGIVYSIFIWQGPVLAEPGICRGQAFIQTLFLIQCGYTFLRDNRNSKLGEVKQIVSSLKRL
jgi:hypothetical protein